MINNYKKFVRADLDYELINKIYFTKNNFNFYKNNILNLLKNYLLFFKTLYDFFKELFFKFRLVNSIEYASPNKSCKVAFISHCDIKNQVINKVDSYYGITKNKKKYQFILLNKANIHGKELNNIIDKYSLSNSYFLNISGSLRLVLFCYANAFWIHISLILEWLLKSRDKLILVAAIDAISKVSVSNLIIFHSLKKIFVVFV